MTNAPTPIAPQTAQEYTYRFECVLKQLYTQGIDGFIVPRSDEYLNEYVPPSGQRLDWSTAFTGSAGVAVLHKNGSALFVDSRYTIQAQNQVDHALIQPYPWNSDAILAWLSQHKGTTIGYDPRLHTPYEINQWGEQAKHAEITLVPVQENPIDLVWPDRPGEANTKTWAHPLCYAGISSAQKREDIAKTLKSENVDVALITMLDSIAWLLNMRSLDVSHTPVALCTLTLHADASVDLFIDSSKVDSDLIEHLGPKVRLHTPKMLKTHLESLAHQTVQVDPKQTSAWHFEVLTQAQATLHKAQDPCILPKACKNETERDGARRAHQHDGVALVSFLRWFDEHAPSGTLNELMASDKLEECRRATEKLIDLSFDTIAGAGPNAAIIHYRPSPSSNRSIEPNTLFLIDSGAQFKEGTTDITRTIVVGTPPLEQRERYTLVLQGHIALSQARFPEGTSGTQLDILARTPLWQAGLNYGHGTGHGVGSFLGVHEGPQHISPRPSNTPLLPGMIVSNEPGYYKENAYGIRIENLIMVRSPDSSTETPMLSFETLTLAPYDKRAIVVSMLTQNEILWINTYHKRVLDELGPLLKDERDRAWLEQACSAL